MPFFDEFKAWRERWPRLKASPRARVSLGGLAAVMFLMMVPLPTHINISGLLKPVDQYVVYAPAHAQVQALPVAEGAPVQAGAVLLRMTAADLESRRQSIQARLQRLRWQTSAGTFDAEQRAQWQVRQEELAAAEAELATIEADAARYVPTAPFDGVLRDLDPELRPGDWLTEREPLARVVANKGQTVVAYLDGEDVGHVMPGASARFYADGLEGPFIPLEVASVEADAAHTLPEPELTSLYGGTVLVREKRGQFYPERGVYRVTLKLMGDAGPLATQTWRGQVVIAGDWRAPAWRYMRSAVAAFWREAGF